MLIIKGVQGMTEAERREAVARVAYSSPDQLKSWLAATDRRWLAIDAIEMVDALPWPEGVRSLQSLLDRYRQHRESLSKPERLTVVELDRAIRYMIGQITEEDSSWDIQNRPL